MNRSAFLIFAIALLVPSCEDEYGDMDFKQEMRDFVSGISEYAKAIHPGFIIIPQNGIELVTTTGEEDGQPHADYLEAIDGNGQEDLYYGSSRDDKATPSNTTSYLQAFLELSRVSGNSILVTDYCSTHSKMDDSYHQNNSDGFVSLAADHRELDNIPAYPSPIYSENSEQISQLSQAQNFLYLINPENYSTKADFIHAVGSTNYDLIIMDLFFHDGTAFTSTEINQLKPKANGGSRLLIAYMSIGEAEDYRYYWEREWSSDEPSWLDKENPAWKGNFKVKYWDKAWQAIIFGSEESYLDRILDADFDGVYLDIIDAFEFFE